MMCISKTIGLCATLLAITAMAAPIAPTTTRVSMMSSALPTHTPLAFAELVDHGSPTINDPFVSTMTIPFVVTAIPTIYHDKHDVNFSGIHQLPPFFALVADLFPAKDGSMPGPVVPEGDAVKDFPAPIHNDNIDNVVSKHNANDTSNNNAHAPAPVVSPRSDLPIIYYCKNVDVMPYVYGKKTDPNAYPCVIHRGYALVFPEGNEEVLRSLLGEILEQVDEGLPEAPPANYLAVSKALIEVPRWVSRGGKMMRNWMTTPGGWQRV